MLLTCSPATDILNAISPDESSLTLTLVFGELPFVGLAFLPLEFAFAMHLAVAPLAGVRPAIRPVVVAKSVHLVLSKGAIVGTAINESELTLTFSFAIDVVALVLAPIRKRFFSRTILGNNPLIASLDIR